MRYLIQGTNNPSAKVNAPHHVQPMKVTHCLRRRPDVIAQMFEWNWASVAAECTSFLGPAGYGFVQGKVINVSTLLPNVDAFLSILLPL